ncbi:MAG: MFS transporter [Caldisphaeraceae archaeon]|nr:MFS transporter [Caldisphaeraceae archaeon]
MVRSLKKKALIFTSLGHFLNDSFLVTFSILITYYIEMGLPPLFLGSMGAIINIVSGLFSMWVGKEADRIDNHDKLMLVGFLIIALSLFLFSLTFVYKLLWLIAVSSILLGVGLSFYHPLGGSILQFTYGSDSPKALGINGSLGSTGRALFPIVLVFLIEYLGGSTALTIIAVYTLVFSSIIYNGIKPIKAKTYSTTQQKERAVSFSSFYYVLIPLTIIVFIRSMFVMGVQTFVPTYLSELFNSKVIMGAVLTVSYATAIFGQPFFGRITASMGGRRVVFITTIFSTIFYIIFIIARNWIVISAIFAAFSFFAFSNFPVLLGYVSQIVDPDVMARANSLVWGIGNTVGGALGILLGGYVFQAFSLKASMLSFVIIALISSFLLPIIPSKTRKRRARQKP